MIVDPSGIMAILLEEPGWERLRLAIGEAEVARMAAPSLVELHIVAGGRNPAFPQRIESMLELLGIDIVPFTRTHAEVAWTVYRTYGKGIHARARLNLGDCFSYALAKATGEPLLFVGDDFPHTDIVSALPA